MKLRGIVSEDFCNYKQPSMFLVSTSCDWKCCKEQNIDIGVCQNAPLVNQPIHDISNRTIYEAYASNPITKAIVVGGLEPMLQIDDIIELIDMFRKYGCHDPFVIYTGYYLNEIQDQIGRLKQYDNIIVKFGRYVPNAPTIYDEVLGITLASDNQIGVKIS